MSLTKIIEERTRIMVMGDILKYYYHHQKDEDMIKVGEALEKVKEEEPFYYKILEFLYLNHWTAKKSWNQLRFCSERTFYYKRDRMLLQIYDYVYGGE